MPNPDTKGALKVTASDYEQPFTTPTFRPGQQGLNLRRTLDTLESGELTRMKNLSWDLDGQLTSRPGLTSLATSAGTRMHSAARLNNPLGVDKRVWGIDSALYLGLSGALASVDTGYSGNPLSLVAHRPPLSSEPWMYVADASRMRKLRGDGLDLEIGLAAPTVALTTALGTERRTNIAEFDADDLTAAASWTAHQGTALAAPTSSDNADSPEDVSNSGHVCFVTNGAGGSQYFSFWSIRHAVDLSIVGTDLGTPIASNDEDHIHAWFKLSNPNEITEVRLYFVIKNFDPASEELPGTAPGSNDQFYVKTIRAGDLAAFFQGGQTASAATTSTAGRLSDEELIKQEEEKRDAEIARYKTLSFTDIDGTAVPYFPEPPRTEENRQQSRQESARGPSGSHEWIEFGVEGAGFPKSHFVRNGQDTSVGWADVEGIIIYVGTQPDVGTAAYFDNMYLTGGAGPDNNEVGMAGYDHRYTHFDPRTGAESNPSPIMADSDGLFAVRRAITTTPASHSDSAIRQRFYRRGGSLGDNWYFLGVNDANGGAYTDESSDSEITVADTVEIDHDQPVTTVDSNGTLVRAQALAAMWGPIQDILFGCGDAYRPGHLYWCIPGEPDHWSSANNFEVCSPSEELMNGGYYGGQGFVFSRERLYWFYPNLTGDGSISVTPSSCAKGLFSRWALATGSTGIYFVNRDGVWRTTGGEPQLLSLALGDEDDGALFSGATVHGYLPIDWTADGDIQLEIWGTELWFQYRDTGGTTRHLVYDLASNRWKWYTWGFDVGTVFADRTTSDGGTRLIIGGRANGDAFTHEGTSDAGTQIACQMRTGAWDAGRAREDKLFGDLLIDMDPSLTTITVQTLLNDETITNGSQTIAATNNGRRRFVLDSFGTDPQRGRSVSTDITWSSGNRAPKIELIGTSVIPEPESTNLRATQWDGMGSANEKWLYGVMIECDTYGVDREVIVEYMQGDTVATASTFTINNDGRRREFYTWTFVRADRVRVRPVTDCAPWILYELSWLQHDQPPRIDGPDSGEEGPWDTYYTGLDLDINTFGVAKTFNVYVDGALVTNPVSGNNDFSVTATGRQVVHLTFGPGRGHIYRWVATDANPCLLYQHKWQLQDEPSEQTNWNQNFSILGTHTDKWIKGIKLECDTFGLNKTVTIEVDGAVAATLTINTTDRSVVHEAFAQVRGRVVRILPTDNNPGRLYSASLIFDEEPLGLDRWETQELNLGSTGWKALLEGWITLRSSATVSLTVTHVREDGTTTDRTYTLPNTSGVKAPYYLTFEADKSVLFKFLFTSAADFWLYRQESKLKIMHWQGGEEEVQPFGDDNLDLVRGLYTAETAASNGGGERK